MFKYLKHTLQEEESGGDKAGGGDTPVEKVEPVVTDTENTDTPSEESNAEVEATTNKEEQTAKPTEEDNTSKTKLEQVKDLVASAGLDIVELAKYAKENNGEVSLEDLVKLKEKHGDAVASLLVDQVKSIHNENKAKADAKDKEVYDQLEEAFKDITQQSGEETWKELSGWTKENISDEHRSEINKLLQMGGLATKLAIQEMTTAYKESIGTNEYQEAGLVEADKLATTSVQPISRSDYIREQNKLLKEGHIYGQSHELAKLDARRSKSLR